METVRKGKGEEEEIVLEKEGDTKRETGVSDLLCGLRATREQTITAQSLFSTLSPSFFPLYPTFPSSLARTARGNSDNSSMLQRSD